jgi:predicted metal-dependent phosphoesterase TrpH
MIGEMHCHTNLSKPRWFHRTVPDPFKLVDHAIEIGLTFLAITDHDTQEAFELVNEYALSKGLVLIPAVEITTHPTPVLRRRAHVLAYGVLNNVKSRLSVRETLDAIHAQNGLAVVAHPFCSKFAKVLYIGHQAGDYDFDGVEIFNSAELQEDNIKAKALSTILGLPGYCGSDAHTIKNVGNARLSVHIKPTTKWQDIVEALRDGKFSIANEGYNSSSYKDKAKDFVFRKWPLPILP